MINFLSKQVFLEESAGKRKFYLIVDGKIKEYEKRMLCDSDCPFTLPMYFISEDGIMKAYYDFTGFIQLGEYMKRKTFHGIPEGESPKMIFDVLDVLTKILECIKGMESYLLFPERISIHPDVFFINSSNGQIVVAFHPNEKIDKPLQSEVIELVEVLNGLCGDIETSQLLKKFKDYIHTNNPGLDGMISILGLLQREASYIFWNTKNFRGGRGEEETESIDGREYADKPFPAVLKKPAQIKLIVTQALIGAALLAVFLSGVLGILNFAGLIILAGAVDLLIIKALRK